jgi:hypothetical protein
MWPTYFVEVLWRFLKAFWKKRPHLVAREWFLHWDNVLGHTAQLVQSFLTKKPNPVIPHPVREIVRISH